MGNKAPFGCVLFLSNISTKKKSKSIHMSQSYSKTKK